jgi:hypothetical protein
MDGIRVLDVICPHHLVTTAHIPLPGLSDHDDGNLHLFSQEFESLDGLTQFLIDVGNGSDKEVEIIEYNQPEIVPLDGVPDEPKARGLFDPEEESP